MLFAADPELEAADGAALGGGELVPLTASNDAVAAFLRRDRDRAVLVIANLGTTPLSGVTVGSTDGALSRGRYALASLLGGPAAAGITVLKPGDKRFGRVIAESPLQQLTPYFGQTVQFPLTTSLPIQEGYIVALTVPTWAPALGLGLGRRHVWRASRDKDACDDTQTQSAQTDVRDLAQYKCFYRTARITYSATMITSPVPPKPPRT